MSPANMKEPRPVAAGAALVNPLRASHRTAAVSDLQERTVLAMRQHEKQQGWT